MSFFRNHGATYHAITWCVFLHAKVYDSCRWAKKGTKPNLGGAADPSPGARKSSLGNLAAKGESKGDAPASWDELDAQDDEVVRHQIFLHGISGRHAGFIGQAGCKQQRDCAVAISPSLLAQLSSTLKQHWRGRPET